jgi:GT2 family glycosyltransferase
MLLPSWRSPLKRARRAARSAKWNQATAAYRKHLRDHPQDFSAWVQLGHSLKEQGDLHAAAQAYLRATQIMPDSEDGWIHLAYIRRKMGLREEAIQALEQAVGIDVEPSTRAVRELVDMGARERLPLAVQIQIEASEGYYARSRYSHYRTARVVDQDIGEDGATLADVLAVIDGRGAPAELIDATRKSLGATTCLVLADGVPPATPVGRLPSMVLLVEAGCRLEPDAVPRLRAALVTTAAVAAYCDHDHWELEESGTAARDANGIRWCDPCFQPMFDPLWFHRPEARPPCIIVSASAAPTMDWGALFTQCLTLPGPYAHVPLVLASRCKKTIAITIPTTIPTGLTLAAKTRIQVIIQTRDAPELLEQCVSSVLRTAARPERLDILIVDNRSILPRTAVLLEKWRTEGVANVLAHDEPFNWARANNLAALQGQAPYLLFLNNDVEMDTMHWDEALLDGLVQENVGALGALLLYPNRLIQHAGVVMDMVAGGPIHEGVGHSLGEGGPAERWRHPRLASAVTGAWLATTRTLFEAVGGFEERLPVAYNDIDFCLRCRAAGRLVVQASHIVATHRESATRGTEMTLAEHARDQADWTWMRSRWGKALGRDPAYNPNWARIGQPFDAIRIPVSHELSRWIAESARKNPWAIAAPF